MKSSLAMSYAIKRKATGKAMGGPIQAMLPDNTRDESVASAIMRKRVMAKNGNFLSDEEQDTALDLSYPDPDGVEEYDGMPKNEKPGETDQEKLKRREALGKIMRGLHGMRVKS